NQFGLSIDAKNQLAYNALKNMGLIDNFAKLIFIAGHGSETENNPYGSGLDCGACGGHAGDVNARVAALVLNEKPVREYLKGQGINIPDDTIFVAGMHNTTTDEFTIYDEEQFQSPDQKKLISEWKNILKSAGEKARLERAPKMGLDSIDHKSIFKKSVDWSETRPEWGLAGNACFIAGSRDLTKNINLQGRSFLHNYDYTKDKDGKVLELIMTAPLVVASWINLQYYASSANNKYFGSGTKTTHNLTGKFAVMQGNSGDLQVGLPFQSVHNGKELVHKPQRLNTIIQAPVEMIKVVLKNHPEVTRLFDNNWIYFTAIDPISEKMFSYEGDGNWELVN
ncbi:MAG: DUF2309 family protein, partial [Leptospiraceae bacterium]|nr:DUF2309 family protein [Leptospiraceae bacterium]